MPVLSIDYMYLGETSEQRKDRKVNESTGIVETPEALMMPILVVRDRETKSTSAHVVPQKGVQEHAVKSIMRDFDYLVYKRVI